MLTKKQAARILADMKPLGEMLKEWREKLKLTPAEAARRCRMSAQHYWQIENAERVHVQAATLQKLSTGTGLPLERLVMASTIEPVRAEESVPA